MQKAILLMDADPMQRKRLVDLLKKKNCPVQAVTSLEEIKKKLEEETFMAVLMDIDSVVVDNRSIKEVVSEFPDTPFLCMSKGRFHPELKDAISQHIYACLSKPIDPEELFYWLKCIRDDHG